MVSSPLRVEPALVCIKDAFTVQLMAIRPSVNVTIPKLLTLLQQYHPRHFAAGKQERKREHKRLEEAEKVERQHFFEEVRAQKMMVQQCKCSTGSDRIIFQKNMETS